MTTSSNNLVAPLISVRNARCRIGRRRLMIVDNFQIEAGQHWCLFGPNGAGKSLLASLIAGGRIESGSYVSYGEGFDAQRDIYKVSFEEQQRLWQRDNRLDISDFNADAQDAGTLVENLIRQARPADRQQQPLFDDLVEQLNLGELTGKGIRFLSTGQIRRVLIARALYAHSEQEPKLILLDDPLESIDKDSQQSISKCIENYLEHGFTSLQLCRRANDIFSGVTHLALMDELTILEQGPRTDVMNSTEFAQLSGRQPELPSSLPPPPTRAQVEEMNDEPLIQLDNVNASYGELDVLNNINWTMGPDHHVLIEGPNGCGKSTLLSLIDGENHKGYGQDVFLFGQRKGSGETVWEIKARFGIVSNELHNKYVKGWRVLDVVVSGFYDSVGLYDDSGSAEWELARKWLAALGIEDLEREYYHEISFGQQRLVLLARAMVKHPAVLILDEPCVGLDDYHRQLILQTLDLIAAQTTTRIIYVSHVSEEQPDCINQKLSFLQNDVGTYTLHQSAV